MDFDHPCTPYFFAPEHLSAPFALRCTVEGQVRVSAIAARDTLICAYLHLDRTNGDHLSCLAYGQHAQRLQLEELKNRRVRLVGHLFDYAAPGAGWHKLVLRALSASVPGAPILLFQRVGDQVPAASARSGRPA